MGHVFVFLLPAAALIKCNSVNHAYSPCSQHVSTTGGLSQKKNTGRRMLPLGFVVFFQGHHGDSGLVLAGHLLVVRPRLQDWRWP